MAANREVLLSIWKSNLLHHAGEAPIHGQWLIEELRRYGDAISRGTLYPLLKRLECLGWLKGKLIGIRFSPRFRSSRARDRRAMSEPQQTQMTSATYDGKKMNTDP